MGQAALEKFLLCP
uniref:Uncharacterized protein n=1 Tax=Anguilla anguilla TaxID=7936 RepID=A0A0E9XUM7_ANGAN